MELFLPIPFLGEGAADRTIAGGRAWAGVTLMSSGPGGHKSKKNRSIHEKQSTLEARILRVAIHRLFNNNCNFFFSDNASEKTGFLY